MTFPFRPTSSRQTHVPARLMRLHSRRDALATLARSVACAGLYGCAPAVTSSADSPPRLEFRLRFTAAARQTPFTGRVYVFLAKGNPQPLTGGENWFNPQPLLAKDVVDLAPGEEVVLAPDDPDTLRDPVDWSTVEWAGSTAQALMRFNPRERKVTTGAGNAFSSAVVLPENEPPPVFTCDTLLADSPVMESRECRLFSVRSQRLSDFYGRDVDVQGMVLVPAGYFENPDRRYPVLFSVPGFGGAAADAFRRTPLNESNTLGVEFIRVTLDPACPLGHHAFVDSANNGPWGTALIEEFLPALAAEYRTLDAPHGRLLTGASSGGWLTGPTSSAASGAWPRTRSTSATSSGSTSIVRERMRIPIPRGAAAPWPARRTASSCGTTASAVVRISSVPEDNSTASKPASVPVATTDVPVSSGIARPATLIPPWRRPGRRSTSGWCCRTAGRSLGRASPESCGSTWERSTPSTSTARRRCSRTPSVSSEATALSSCTKGPITARF